MADSDFDVTFTDDSAATAIHRATGHRYDCVVAPDAPHVRMLTWRDGDNPARTGSAGHSADWFKNAAESAITNAARRRGSIR